MVAQPDVSPWVKNLLNVLKKSGLHHVALAFEGVEFSVHQRGYGLGMFRASLALAEKMAVGQTPGRTLSKDGSAELVKMSGNLVQELVNKTGGQLPTDNELRDTLWLVYSEEEPADAADFFRGLADGLNHAQPDNKRDTLATPVHLWLLLNWRAIERFPNIPALHRCYIAKGGDAKLFPLGRFAQICRRLELHLAEAGRPRKKQSSHPGD